MKCFIYKSLKKADTYIYLSEKDNFQDVPERLMKIFGAPQFTFEFELHAARKLAVADAKQVIASLQQQGYYLQIPAENSLPA